MLVARNTNQMMWRAYDYISTYGIEELSRNGPVLTVPHPVTLCYTHPLEQVNFCPNRNINPFFHFMEKLWMLEGVGDTEFICKFLPRMIEYSDDGVYFNAHYGYNLQHLFHYNQLDEIINVLWEDPLTRQAVAQIWNPQDLGKVTKDKSCNMQLVFRTVDSKLDMTVFNRSNDGVWGGISGANITNLLAFHEYVAAGLDISIGKQYIVTNNLHLYKDNPQTQVMLEIYAGRTFMYVQQYQQSTDPYWVENLTPTPMIDCFGSFKDDLFRFTNDVREDKLSSGSYRNAIFNGCAIPMYKTFMAHKEKNPGLALELAATIQPPDWRLSVTNWLKRRYEQ